jgi:hypothetical protein
MNTHYSFILSAAILVTTAFAIGITSVPFQTAVADPPPKTRCFSIQTENPDPDEEDITRRTCYTPVEGGAKIGQTCEVYREQEDVKCSGSQTGFGAFAPGQRD